MTDVAVIGAGAIAQEAYLPAVSAISEARLQYVVDVDEERARKTAREFDAEGYATDHQMLGGTVDAVVVATPPRYHADIAEWFLADGIHVFAEKPVATTSQRGWELVGLSDDEDVHFAISRQLREAPAARTLRSFCQNGAIGTPTDISIRFGDETRWEFASDYRLREELAWGGVLTDRAPHVLDLLLWIFGPEATIEAYRDDSLGGLEANAEIDMRVGPDQTDVAIEVTADRDISQYIRVSGTAGHLEGDPHDNTMIFHDRNEEKINLQPSNGTALHRFLPRVGKQLERFVTAVDGGPVEYVPAADGVRVVEWLEQCFETREQLVHSWEQLPDRRPKLEV